jgi:hypothetical protein
LIQNGAVRNQHSMPTIIRVMCETNEMIPMNTRIDGINVKPKPIKETIFKIIYFMFLLVKPKLNVSYSFFFGTPD